MAWVLIVKLVGESAPVNLLNGAGDRFLFRTSEQDLPDSAHGMIGM